MTYGMDASPITHSSHCTVYPQSLSILMTAQTDPSKAVVSMLLNTQIVVDEHLSAFHRCLFRAVLLHLLMQPPGCNTVKLLDWLFLGDGQSCM